MAMFLTVYGFCFDAQKNLCITSSGYMSRAAPGDKHGFFSFDGSVQNSSSRMCFAPEHICALVFPMQNHTARATYILYSRFESHFEALDLEI